MRVEATANLEPAPGHVRRALLSVFDKTGLIELAQSLALHEVELLASGGTATALEKAGLSVTRIEVFTGAREVLDGRVKTLHPKIHAGVLADRRLSEHERDLKESDYAPIDVVVCNLYPFEKALERQAPRHEMIENIDIGGPTLVRAAAKNEAGGVTVVVDPADYTRVADAIAHSGAVPSQVRRALAAKAFGVIARYDAAIAEWYAKDLLQSPHAEGREPMAEGRTPNAEGRGPAAEGREPNAEGRTPTADGRLPMADCRLANAELPSALASFARVEVLRYGENPHQPGALYRAVGEGNGVANGHLLAGKQLSYNNLLDMDAAYRAVFQLAGTGCAIVKHTNPCGLAEAPSQTEAFVQALAGDPVSAFGGILGFNSIVERPTVEALKAAKLFVECVVAPGFAPDAQIELEKRENLRLFVVPTGSPEPAWHAHRIGGGMLVEAADPGLADPPTWTLVSKRKLDSTWRDELAFAMRAAMLLKSNSIAITRGRRLLGAGAGQMSRVDAAEQALKKAGAAAQGGFLGSDAFFPFDDVVKLAAKAGIVAIAQPGGSKRDADSIAACDAAGIAMVFTNRRHFRH